MLWALLAIVFIDVVFLAIGISSVKIRSNPVSRLKRYFEVEEKQRDRMDLKLNRNSLQIFFRNIGSALVKIFILERLRVRLEHDLERADIPVRGEEMLLILFSATTISFLVALYITKDILKSLLVIPILIVMVRIIINNKIKKRLETINEQLGDALDMMASSLRAGYSFNQAMETVGMEMPNPIGGEFKKVTKETSYGISIDESLDKMMERLPFEDLSLVIMAVKIQRQIGGNLAEILDNISGTIRQRIQLKGEVRALTAQGKVSGVIASLAPIFFAVFMYFNSPESIMLLFTDSTGQKLLLAGVIGQLLGFFFISRIIDIKY